MGATVFNNARVLSKKLSNGKVIFLWEENTHCIKDGPKAADWCAMEFGDLKAMLCRIYDLAASIPGGMLKVQGRTPVRFVLDMLDAVHSPALLQKEEVCLENTKRGFHSAITDENRVQAAKRLTEIGRPDLAARLDKSKEEGGEGSIRLEIDNDFEAINTLVNDCSFQGSGNWWTSRGVSVWKVFPSYSYGYSGTDGPSVPAPMQPPSTKPDVRLYRSKIDTRYTGSRDPEFVHVMTLDGRVEFVGRNDYELEVVLIKIAREKHVQDGVFFIKDAFSALARARKSVEDLAEDVAFRFHTPGESKWYRDSFNAISKEFTGEVCEDFTVSHGKLASLSEKHGSTIRIVVESAGQGGCVVDVELEGAYAQPPLF